MKPRLLEYLLALSFLSTLNPQLSTVFAQGTAFTYQGRLNDGANPANGVYDLRFTVYDAGTGGNPVGGPVTALALGVTNGLFNVALDFGAGLFDGSARWLEISARTNGSAVLLTLTPRQPLTTTPYAIRAREAGAYAGAISDSQLSTNIARLNGSGQVFTGPVTFSSPANLFAGRFTGDGSGVTNVDLGRLAPDGIVSVSTNGPFASAVTVSVGPQPRFVLTSDVNRDGWPDLVCGSVGEGGSIRVMTNDSRGGFSVMATIAPYGGLDMFDLVVADINGDEWPDLATANGNYQHLTFYTNSHSGGFAQSASPAAGSSPSTFVAGDVNGDGSVDFVVGSYSTNVLTVMTNNGFGVCSPSRIVSVMGTTAGLTGADVNGDGAMDLLVRFYNSTDVAVLTNNGTGDFAIAATLHVAAMANSLSTGDVNGDRRADVVVSDFQSGITVFTNAGSGTFQQAGLYWTGANSTALAIADVNNDGGPDLILADYFLGCISIWLNRGSTTFAPWITVPSGASPNTVIAADFNGDKRIDLVAANETTASLTVLLGQSFASFNGDFSGDGSRLVGLNASNILTGTIAEARLSTNVALRSGGNTFSDDQIVAGGKIGIGTTSPQAPLHVAATGDAWIWSESTTAERCGVVSVRAPGGHGDLTFGGNTFASWGGPRSLNLINAADGPITFDHYLNGQPIERLRIPNGGVFGLQVSSGILLNGGWANLGGNDLSLLRNSAQMLLGWNKSSGMGEADFVSNRGNGSDGGFAFYDVANDGTVTHLMQLKGNGRVGIGTMNPDSTLEVAGTVAASAFAAPGDHALELVVGGQRALRLEPNTESPNVMGGYAGNIVDPGLQGALVIGGGSSGTPNRVAGSYATVAGGLGNEASGQFSIAMGYHTKASGSFSIAMGDSVRASGLDSTAIGSGATASGNSSVALGGGAIASGDNSTALGTATTASAPYSTAMGWRTTASHWASTAMGHDTEASGPESTAMGFSTVAAGNCSFAGGSYAQATNDGAFVWSDTSSAVPFGSTADNQFCVRASGGVHLSDSTPSVSFGSTTRQMLNLYASVYGLGVQAYSMYFRCDGNYNENGFLWYKGGQHADAYGDPGGGQELMRLTGSGLSVNGSFVSSSDRNAKENFIPVDTRAVLDKVAALPLSEWNYKQDAATRHLGPMAQDFYAAFHVGPDDKHIATVDADGVALAAIQGLNQKVETGKQNAEARIVKLEQTLQQKETELAELKQRLESLQRLFTYKLDGVAQ